MGSCPQWYIVIKAAKYLGVPPWDLIKQPQAWVYWALQAESAEAEAERQQIEAAERKASAGKG